MATTYVSNFGKDVLRQECMELLRSYVPKKMVKKSVSNSSELPPMKTKEQIRAKNEAYARSMEEVMQVDRDAAIQRNKQAFEGFLENLINAPEKVFEPTKAIRAVTKRKVSTPKSASKVPKVRKVKGQKQQEIYSYPMQYQSDFQPQFNQTFQHPQQFNQSFQKPEQILPQPNEIDLYEMYQF